MVAYTTDPSAAGTVPVSELKPRSKYVSALRALRVGGSVPARRVDRRLRYHSFESALIDAGNGPAMRGMFCTVRLVRAVMAPRAAGSAPDHAPYVAWNVCRRLKAVMNDGKVPLKCDHCIVNVVNADIPLNAVDSVPFIAVPSRLSTYRDMKSKGGI